MLAGCRTGGVLGSEVNPDSFLLSWWGLSHVLFPMWVYCLQPCRVLKFFQNCIKRGTFGSLCSLPTRPNSQHGALTAEPLDTTPTRFGLCWSCGGGVFFGEHQPISIRLQYHPGLSFPPNIILTNSFDPNLVLALRPTNLYGHTVREQCTKRAPRMRLHRP